MAIKESNGIHKGETIYCPVNGWDCPYFEDGICYYADHDGNVFVLNF